MCHLISTATLKNATPQRVDRSNWDGLRGQCRNSAVGRALPRIAPTAVGTPPFLTRHVSWLFTRASPGLIHERGNLTLPHDHPISSFSAAPTPSKPALSGIGAPRLGRSGAQHLSQFDFVTFTRSALFVARPLTLPGHAPWRRCHLYPLRPRVHHTGARPTPSIFHRSHVRHTGARPTSSFWIRYGTCQGPPLITPLVSGSPSPVRP